MRRLIRAILAMGLAAVLPVTAYAMSDQGTAPPADSSIEDDPAGETEFDWSAYDYEGSGSLTREEVKQLEQLVEMGDTGVDFEEAKDVQLTFDTDTNRYQYTFPNQYQMEVSVPNGAVTTGSVILQASKDSTSITATKDNKPYDLGDSYYFSEPGSYELNLLCSPQDYSGDNLVIYQYRFSFQILKEGCSRQDFLVAPDGYEIGHITREGQPVRITNTVCMNLQEDGNYQVRFSADGLPDYRITFLKDTIAPTLTFSKSIMGKALKLPVSFEKMQTDSEVTVYRDGNEVKLSDQTLKQGGWYLIRVSDKAGNSRDYHFFVKQTYHLFNKHLAILLGVVLLGMLLTGAGSLQLRRRS